MALDIIKDPVTGKQFSRDTAIAGSTYAPYTAPTTPATPTPITAPTTTPTVQSIQQGLNDILKGLGGIPNSQTGQMSITADQLSKATETPIQLPTPSSSLGTSANAMVAGVQERLKAEEAFKTAEQKEGEDKVSKMIADVEARMNEMEGKGAYAAEQYKAAGATPKAKAAITSVKSKIAAKTAEFNAIEADYMKAVQATEKVPGTTTGIVAGQQRELARDLAYQRTAQAAQIGILQAEQLALTGAYNDAIEVANNAVELKYGSIKENIALRLQQIELIQGQLNAKEKKVADAMTAYLKQQDTLIGIQVANLKDENAEKINIMSKYYVPGMDINDPLEVLLQKKLSSPVYKKEITVTPTSATEIPLIQNKLVATRGADGFVNPISYLEERRKSKMSPTEFDQRFGDLLSPQERKNLGIGGAAAKSGAEQRLQELLQKSNNGTNLDALTPEEITELYTSL